MTASWGNFTMQKKRCVVHCATRKQLKGHPMLNSEIAQLLRTAAARLDGTDAYLAPTTPTTPRAAPAADSAPKISGGACPPGMLRGMCTFWKMDTTSSGRARGRVGVSWRDAGGEHKEYYNCFDEKVLHKIDPVPVGMPIEIELKPWKDTSVITALNVRMDRA